MGEMGSPSRGSSSFPYNRVVPSLIEEISTAQFSNSNIRAIEEDLALIRQGEQEQQHQLSDEDTEDASETDQQKKEDEYIEIREQIYRDKLAYLKQQLEQLEQGLHPDYLRKLKKLETVFKDRLLLNEVWKEYEIQRAEEEYVLEKEFAGRELEEKKVELQDNLISEYEEKKRNVESERITIELTGDSMEIKPVTTRKLRRRPNDPINVNSSAGSSDKRRKLAPAQLAYLLDESEIIDDLRAITRGTGTSVMVAGTVAMVMESVPNEIRTPILQLDTWTNHQTDHPFTAHTHRGIILLTISLHSKPELKMENYFTKSGGIIAAKLYKSRVRRQDSPALFQPLEQKLFGSAVRPMEVK